MLEGKTDTKSLHCDTGGSNDIPSPILGISLSEGLICDASLPQDRSGKRLCLQEDLEGPFKACPRVSYSPL